MRPSSATAFLKRVFEALDTASIRYCVERNYEEYPTRITGDVDLIVCAASFPPAVKILRRAAKELNWQVFVEYVSTQAVHLGFFADNYPERFCLVIELFNGGVWRGMTFLPADEILNQRIKCNGTWKPHPAHEAIITLMHHLLYNGSVCEKYRNRIGCRYRESPDCFQSELAYGFGKGLASAISEQVAAANWKALEDRVARFRNRFFVQSLLRRPLKSFSGAMAMRADVSRKPEGAVISLNGMRDEEAHALAEALIGLAVKWHVFLPPIREKVDMTDGNVVVAAEEIMRIQKAGGVAVVVNPDSLDVPVTKLSKTPFTITSPNGRLTINCGDAECQLTSRETGEAAYESWAFVLGNGASKHD